MTRLVSKYVKIFIGDNKFFFEKMKKEENNW